MPYRKKGENYPWKSTNSFKTKIEKGEFIEKCTLWFTTEDKRCEKILPLRATICPLDVTHLPKMTDYQSCFSPFENEVILQKECLLCGARNDLIQVLGNPYAARRLVSICRDTCTA